MTRTGKLFLVSFQSEEKALEIIIENGLEKDPWNKMLPDVWLKKEVMLTISENVKMYHGLKRTISDVLVVRIRAGKDCLFESLRYGRPFIRTSAPTAKRKRRKRCKVVVARRKML